METWQYVLLLIILALAFPAGLFIARATKEELKSGRFIFKILIACSIAVIVATFCLRAGPETKILVTVSMFFLIIISAVSLKKSYK